MSKNPYMLFQIPLTYDVDKQQIERTYFRLQKEFHPDRYRHVSSLEHEAAKVQSGHINTAFRILNDPIDRAKSLLEAHQETMDDAIEDPDFLMDIMELQETLEAQPSVSFYESLVERRQKIEETLRTAFLNKDLKTAKQALLKLKYLDNLVKDGKKKLSLEGDAKEIQKDLSTSQ